MFWVLGSTLIRRLIDDEMHSDIKHKGFGGAKGISIGWYARAVASPLC